MGKKIFPWGDCAWDREVNVRKDMLWDKRNTIKILGSITTFGQSFYVHLCSYGD